MKIIQRLRGRKGQTTTEYMLIIGVVVAGLIAAATYFIEPFKGAVVNLAGNVSGWMTEQQTMMKP